MSLLVLQRREGNGRVKTYTVYRDDATAAAAPTDVKELPRALAGMTLVTSKVL